LAAWKERALADIWDKKGQAAHAAPHGAQRGLGLELLAPAGDMDALIAAVKAGADAVYLGGKALNARQGAGNFEEDQLVRAAAHCHERDRRVYVTVNTLVKNAELQVLEQLARQLARAGVDGAIVQDLGVASALQAMMPELKLHASTQMAIHNRQGVDFLRANGFARVVLAREMDLSEIAQCGGRGVELEVFAHGALCVSSSGQCLMSSVIGGRSGNRGMCAQPCRLNYVLDGPSARASSALLSTKDLMRIDSLAQLSGAGVCSLKIEGRLKNPDYVGTVTAAYRRAIDALSGGEAPDRNTLRSVFNRGYTQGYEAGFCDAQLLEDQSEKHVEGTASWSEIPRPIFVSARLTAVKGAPVSLWVSDGADQVTLEGEAAQDAAVRPSDGRRLSAQLKKTGGTPYEMKDAQVFIEPGCFVPISAVNALRRRALELLGAARAARRRGCAIAVRPMPRPAVAQAKADRPQLSVSSADGALLMKARAWGADELIFEPTDLTAEDFGGAPDGPFTLLLPPTLPARDLDRLHDWACKDGRIEQVIASNPAHLALSWTRPLRLDAAMNIANDLAVARFDLPYMPSVELTAHEIQSMGGEKELFVYGDLTLMRLRHCPVRARMGGPHETCRLCDAHPEIGLGAHTLTDRKGARFPMRRVKTGGGCIVEIDNCVPVFLLRSAGRIPAGARWRVRLAGQGDLAESIVRLHRAALDAQDVKSLPQWGAVDAQKTTTGHYFRGVE
jgi:putative protease